MTADLRILEHRVGTVETAISEIRDAVTAIARGVDTLASLEVRHAETRSALERAFAAIAKAEQEATDLESRVRAVEIAMPGLKEVRAWVIGGILAVVGILGTAVLAGTRL